jgi:hypothetical protein
MTLTRPGWWTLLVTALLIVGAWPPERGQSLLLKGVHRAADPTGSLPFLPEQLDFGLSDDPQAVELRDELVRRYDVALASGPLARARLKLKVVDDPFDRATERQILLVFGVVMAFVVMRPRG